MTISARERIVRDSARAIWNATLLIRVASTPENLRAALRTVEDSARGLRDVLDAWEARHKGGGT